MASVLIANHRFTWFVRVANSAKGLRATVAPAVPATIELLDVDLRRAGLHKSEIGRVEVFHPRCRIGGRGAILQGVDLHLSRLRQHEQSGRSLQAADIRADRGIA